MQTKKLIILGTLLIIICILIGAILGIITQNPEKIEINDLNLQQDEFGIYNLQGHITPLKDLDYLEARIIFYDAQNTILSTGYAWNMNNLKKGEKISLNNGMGATCNENPDHAVIGFYDDIGGKDMIANFTIKFN